MSHILCPRLPPLAKANRQELVIREPRRLPRLSFADGADPRCLGRGTALRESSSRVRLGVRDPRAPCQRRKRSGCSGAGLRRDCQGWLPATRGIRFIWHRRGLRLTHQRRAIVGVSRTGLLTQKSCTGEWPKGPTRFKLATVWLNGEASSVCLVLLLAARESTRRVGVGSFATLLNGGE